MKTSSESLARDQYITVMMIALHVIMTLTIITLLTAIFGRWMGLGVLFMSIPVGIIVWTLVLFKTSVFDWSFFNVKPNWALIVGNQTTWDKIPLAPKAGEKDQRTEMFMLASMREVGPGVRGKWWTEVVYDSVDLQSELVIGNNGKSETLLKCYTSNGIALDIKWQGILTPLRGYLVNLVRKGEEAAKAFFRGEFEQFIIDWVKKHTEDSLFAALDDLKTAFSDLFGGQDKLDKREIEYGIFTNTPQILAVIRSTRYEAAAEGMVIGVKAAEVVKGIMKMYEGGEKPDPNMVLAVATTLVGEEVAGMLLIPGLGGKADGKDMASLIAAGQRFMETKKGKK